MCGIAGVIDFSGQPLDPGVLARMATILCHRGPDEQGSWLLPPGPITGGLAHTRLRIVDLSRAAAQPMATDDGAICLVFNGEIYNFRELRASLEQRGARFRSHSDTEVLLRAYEFDGDACIESLEGMFALAIWDHRRQRLLLARDRVGKKPLFYATNGRRIVFGSEIKAVFRHPDVASEVRHDALPSLLTFGYVPAPATCYRGIEQLPAGHWLSWEQGKPPTLRRYWDVPLPDGAAPRPPPMTEREAARELREHLERAVRRRLVADVPLGAFLSGGIDSSIVVGLMSRLVDKPVRTFSIGFAGCPDYDETSHARAVAAHFGTIHTEFLVRPQAVELIERLVWHHDGPFADSSALPTYLLSKLTREHVTVALNGDGGDELFAGYQRFAATLLAERIPGPARRAARRLLARVPDWGRHGSFIRQARKFADAASLPFFDRLMRWVSVFYEDLPQLLPGARLPSPPWQSEPADPLLAERLTRASPLTRLLYVNFKTYLAGDLLVKMDRTSMAHGLEARSPFLDHRVVEFAFGLPDRWKLRGLTTKVLLRRAFADLVPASVFQRRKMGFGVPLRPWFRGELRGFVHDVLDSPTTRLRQWLNHDAVRRLCHEHARGQADHSHRLWMLLTFEIWLRNIRLEGNEASREQGGDHAPSQRKILAGR